MAPGQKHQSCTPTVRECGLPNPRRGRKRRLIMNDEIFQRVLEPGEPLAAQIKKILVRKIVTNEYRPGERLSENELSTSLGVSRQPVRDALIRLGEAGLVRALPQRAPGGPRIAIPQVFSGRFVRGATQVAGVPGGAVSSGP